MSTDETFGEAMDRLARAIDQLPLLPRLYMRWRHRRVRRHVDRRRDQALTRAWHQEAS